MTSKSSASVALLLAAAFFLLRHSILRVQFDTALWSALIDKWSLGALRLLNFSSFALLFAVTQTRLAHWITVPTLVSLGKASLEVFCAHLLFCFGVLAVVGDGAGLARSIQVGLISVTLIGLYIVARLCEKPKKSAGASSARIQSIGRNLLTLANAQMLSTSAQR
jgi:hypothetical protein